MARIVCQGEAMLELSGAPGGWSVGYGGDTLNTAIHLARLGHEVAYMTALGDDGFSDDLRANWTREGLDCSLVLTHPTRTVGLYAIRNSADGERSFTYWREDSAARAMFAIDRIEEAAQTAAQADLFSFSLISLAILPTGGREALLDLARALRMKGGQVAFDGNYRARLWESTEAACQWRDAAVAIATIGLPTLEDEVALSGTSTAPEVAAHWRGLGCAEVVVKLGSKGCLLPNSAIAPVPVTFKPVDTSGAGDAFNAGYLAARMQGAAIDAAAVAGHELAGWTVMRRGAIPAKDDHAPYA